MQGKVTSVWHNSLIWFGAAVSIAEILTGTLLAPLGFAKGMLAIVLGHVIGCLLLYAAGLIGAKTKKSAMETVKRSFGEKGAMLFSAANVLQLVGWTAVMIVSGAAAAQILVQLPAVWMWSVILGVLILLWLLLGVNKLNWLHITMLSLLFLLTIGLSLVVFQDGAAGQPLHDSLRFGAGVELAVAMPLSWLPLISDYTRHAQKPRAATAASVLVYFLVSCWMYAIGLGAALFTGESDIARIMLQSGMGIAGLLIVLLSTVTTTFLDAYSAGVSAVSICGKWREKAASIVVCLLGIGLAVFTPISQYESFLYLIGSFFAPMVAILLTDYYLLRKDRSQQAFSVTALAVWAVGFVLYRLAMQLETPLGYTLPVMIVTAMLYILVVYIQEKFSRRTSHVRNHLE